jgi:hypothetical protein
MQTKRVCSSKWHWPKKGMGMKLPNGDQAVVDIAKLRDYCLNKDHLRGRHKARVFAAVLGRPAMLMTCGNHCSMRPKERMQPLGNRIGMDSVI